METGIREQDQGLSTKIEGRPGGEDQRVVRIIQVLLRFKNVNGLRTKPPFLRLEKFINKGMDILPKDHSKLYFSGPVFNSMTKTPSRTLDEEENTRNFLLKKRYIIVIQSQISRGESRRVNSQLSTKTTRYFRCRKVTLQIQQEQLRENQDGRSISQTYLEGRRPKRREGG